MSRLAYRTKGNGNPQGKERVFFTCYPDDFDRYFESVCTDIFKTQNCAVWYDEEPTTGWTLEEMETELSRMQLIVIPVTSHFLYRKNDARKVIFPFAMQHHIPLLPLMQEKGLENEFNRICGDLQFLDKNSLSMDPTALPYEQKLERFLSSVLMGDDLTEKIRKAFDAYIFLSYRKKDRKYAQELMRLIHQNNFCRDIAIWYDEYLVPGEGFNHAIREAMEKSDLFALVVTPNLLEQDNYVMTTEYPAAQKTGRPILPVEMVPTNREELREKYEQIPEPADAHNVSALSDALIEKLHKIAIEENENDPSHLYFIGLAYLSGIDVEEDRERGVNLITAAAESDLPEAMEKLAQMYYSGHGVERNYECSNMWLKKLAEYWKKKFDEDGNEETAIKLFRVFNDIFTDDWDENEMLTHEMLELSENMFEKTNNYSWKTRETICCDRLAIISKVVRRDLCGAEEWYERSLMLEQEVRQERGDASSLHNLKNAYKRLGDFYKETGDLSRANELYEKRMSVVEELAHMPGELGKHAREEMRLVYYKKRKACADDDLDGAKQWLEKKLEMDLALFEETRTDESRWALEDDDYWYVLVATYFDLGNICVKMGDLSGAMNRYLDCLRMYDLINPQLLNADLKKDLCNLYYNLGFVSKMERKFKEMWKWYTKYADIFIDLRYQEKNSKSGQPKGKKGIIFK